MLQSVADMIYELSLPTTWELLRHYLEPYVSPTSTTYNASTSHHLHWTKRKHDHAPQSIPMSFIYDTKIPDDSNILSPLLFDEYKDTLYENPFHEYDESLLHPPEPNDPNPQVVWLLSFPNSVCLLCDFVSNFGFYLFAHQYQRSSCFLFLVRVHRIPSIT